LHRAPFGGDPLAVRVGNMVVALRLAMARLIELVAVESSTELCGESAARLPGESAARLCGESPAAQPAIAAE
jgi:hypothetical protein